MNLKQNFFCYFFQVKYKKHKRGGSGKHSLSSPSTPMSLPPPPSPVMSTPRMSPAIHQMSPSPSSVHDLQCVTSMTSSIPGTSSSPLMSTSLKYVMTSSHYQQPHSPVDISPYSRNSPNKTLLPSGINILRAALTGSPDVSFVVFVDVIVAVEVLVLLLLMPCCCRCRCLC